MTTPMAAGNDPRLDGHTVVVTGANAGLGFITARELAARGGRVILACRSAERGRDAAQRITDVMPSAHLDVVALDLASLDSAQAAAKQVAQLTDTVHVLVNNAGVVNLPTLQRTADGHEMHLGTNHFGHFAFTRGLWPLLLATETPRVVTLSSGGHRFAELRLDDLGWERRPYKAVAAYGTSKLANLFFMRGVQRRLDAAGSWGMSVAAHPGLSGTERQQSVGRGGVFTRVAAAPPELGVRSQLLAATSPSVLPGAFYGPRFGMRGEPHQVDIRLDPILEDRLWRMTERITGIDFPADGS